MKRRLVVGSVILLIVLVLGAGYSLYLYYKPHLDIQATQADFKVESNTLVDEFLENNEEAKKKYFPANSRSKILVVSGPIASISENMNGQKVILLKKNDKEIGVSCTFSNHENEKINVLEVGDNVAIKGILRSGAGYDEDLGLYEDVILEKCDLYLNEEGANQGSYKRQP